MVETAFWHPTTKTISQEKISTMPVRKAVAKSEDTDLIPALASTEVAPAKKALPTANKIHIKSPTSFHQKSLAAR
jgi:hypothetical protein